MVHPAQFKPGQSGNPAGRPKGVKDRRVALREKLQPHLDDLVDTVIQYAKAGDMQAMKIIIDRLCPPAKEDPLRIALPKISCAADCVSATAAVLNGVASGQMLPSEGQVMTALIEAQRKAYETSEFAKRIEALEDAAAGRRGAQ